MRHIHLQPLGGAAGDMVVACLLDAFPEIREHVTAAAAAVSGAACDLVPHTDGTLTGSRFAVGTRPEHDHRHAHHGHGHEVGHDHAVHDHAVHGHVPWRAIRDRLATAPLPQAVRDCAIGIFTVLAQAEGRVHGVDADAVAFHEVGAVDSVADIVAAAAAIVAIGPARWSVSALPIGGGIVRTQHGPMPVPAPATAILLEGFALHDDGVAGERVTPTGAAILRSLVGGTADTPGGTLARSGYGFGTKTLPGVSNCLRAMVFETVGATGIAAHRELAVISFEVDDQSAEDLAIGLAHVRAVPGVHDVIQIAAFGKKSRLATHVQVLVAPETLDAAVDACFRETTTIGLRTHVVQGRALPRAFAQTAADGVTVAVKRARRPDGTVTGKAEADDLAAIATHAARQRARQQAEHLAVDTVP